VPDAKERQRAARTFHRHGPVIIILARALPMLPEVSSCMAGATRMPFAKFIGLWLVNIVPYCMLAAYAGSVSSVDDPTPAIVAAIGLSASFWVAWAIFNRRQKRH
jgi:membrane protein DedA with SNARE-associated domain